MPQANASEVLTAYGLSMVGGGGPTTFKVLLFSKS